MTTELPPTASVHIAADPERVFDYFTKPAAILRWMGDYAVLDPRPGGQFTLDINGVPVRGRYLAVDRPHRLLLSWGHAGSDRLPPGGSTVEVTFVPEGGGTTVTVVHSGLPAADAEQHRLGWAHFLDRLVVAAQGGDPGPDPWSDRQPETAGITVGEDGLARCWWSADDPLYRRYHDLEWGRPVDHDQRLFEKLSLEGFQAGLSWLTILRKRENFRKAFQGFDIEAVARFGAPRVDRLLADAGIVRNQAKIQATINNARRCLELIDEFDSLAGYVWRFEPDPRSRPAVLDHAALLQITDSPESRAMSRDLRRRGWSFVGPTTAYAFMEATGLINDHLDQCDVRMDVERERHQFQRPPGARQQPP